MSVDPAWKGLFKIGGLSAIIFGIISISSLPLVFPIVSAFPPSTGAEAIVAVAENSLVFLTFEIIFALETILFILFVFALYFLLKEVSRAATIIAVGLAVISQILALVDTAVAFSLARLANLYATASGAQQAALLGAAELAQGVRTGLDFIAGPIVAVSIIIIGLVMLRGGVFRKSTAYLGVVGGILSIEPLPVPALGVLGLVVPFAGALLLSIWPLPMGYKLYKVGSADSREKSVKT